MDIDTIDAVIDEFGKKTGNKKITSTQFYKIKEGFFDARRGDAMRVRASDKHGFYTDDEWTAYEIGWRHGTKKNKAERKHG